MQMHSKDILALQKMGEAAVRSHGIDGDEINSDSIDDAVHPGVFGEAVNDERFSHYEAAEISDVLHEAIANTYWHKVDEANGLDSYQEMQGELESGECAVIHDNGSVSFNGKTLGQFNEHDERMAAIRQAMDEAKFWPNIYSVNDHGNVSLLDSKGNEIKGWV